MLPDFKFHHIGIAVFDIDDTAQYYIDAGYQKTETVIDTIQNVKICFLTKEGMPLLRYRTKDLTALHYEKCSCGRTLVRMDRILGRSDDMLIIRGVNVFPTQIESVILEMPEFEPHYLLLVDRKNNTDTMELQVEVRPEYYSDEINKMLALKKKLVDYIRMQFSEKWLRNQGDPSRVVSLLERINPNALIIGFCRRFATYKRAHLLFTDLERLEKIVNNPERPVQFLFSGKAHPADGAGQGLIKRIYEISQRPEFLGKIIFLEDYDYQLARRLVAGVDIWMNTPTRPLEASGTSGEKAEMNGVVNLSVLDGWWLEGYREGAGWALTEKRTYQNQSYQDQLDAATIYSMLEREIIPLYYAKNEKGYSEGWIKVIKNSIAQIAPHYTMKRQLDDYYTKFYEKEAARFKMLSADDNRVAKEIAQWKEVVAERWDAIEVVSCEWDIPASGVETGKEYTIKYVLNEQGLDDAIGLEFVSVKSDDDGEERISSIIPLKVVSHEGNNYTFEGKLEANSAGTFKGAIRMYPKNSKLPHRQDFCYVKWFTLPNDK